MNNVYLSYGDFIKAYKNFRQVDHEGFNRYDSPANLYFRLVFYFNEEQGLLGLNGMTFDENSNEFESKVAELKAAFTDKNGKADKNGTVKTTSLEIKNTAYHYLLLNDEIERANLLKRFVILLSDINSKSPWYFTEIGGLDAALERKMFDKDFKIEEDRRQITIKCLADAYDNRIGTLLDMYRQICYSYTMKREVVPANLRKFNMGVMIFNQPIRGLGGKSGEENAKIMIPGSQLNMYVPSCKLIELRNCEIDQNSSKTPWGTLKADEPLSPEYTITISYDDAYESRYNEIMQGVITDFINVDLYANYEYSKNDECFGKTPEGVRPLKLTAGGEAYKGYWTNVNPENSPYNNPMSENSDYQTIRDVNDVSFKGPFSSLASGVVDKFNKAIQIPDIIPDKSIHDAGTVSAYGVYEYLNRIKGTDGLLGQAATTVGSQTAKYVKEKVAGLLLGNIYTGGIGNYLSYASKLVSGDYTGFTKDMMNEAKKKQSAELSDSLIGKKLPQYTTSKQRALTSKNMKKSIYNSL